MRNQRWMMREEVAPQKFLINYTNTKRQSPPIRPIILRMRQSINNNNRRRKILQRITQMRPTTLIIKRLSQCLYISTKNIDKTMAKPHISVKRRYVTLDYSPCTIPYLLNQLDRIRCTCRHCFSLDKIQCLCIKDYFFEGVLCIFSLSPSFGIS